MGAAEAAAPCGRAAEARSECTAWGMAGCRHGEVARASTGRSRWRASLESSCGLASPRSQGVPTSPPGLSRGTPCCGVAARGAREGGVGPASPGDACCAARGLVVDGSRESSSGMAEAWSSEVAREEAREERGEAGPARGVCACSAHAPRTTSWEGGPSWEKHRADTASALRDADARRVGCRLMRKSYTSTVPPSAPAAIVTPSSWNASAVSGAGASTFFTARRWAAS
mmetsp:Transcript_14975/g.50505  ORF Transcript_14975/g.50505 Transcript_14975/m.50505 type:complete len:228 (+) Transcript_14975:14-697(+)